MFIEVVKGGGALVGEQYIGGGKIITLGMGGGWERGGGGVEREALS